jgi:hypothetical protein
MLAQDGSFDTITRKDMPDGGENVATQILGAVLPINGFTPDQKFLA